MYKQQVLPVEGQYDPTIQSLLAKTDQDWGNPEENRELLIPYGISHLDKATYGLDPSGELVLVQGEEKNRKSTFVVNVIPSFMRARTPPVVAIDVLESGMRVEKYRDWLISVEVARYLMEQGHRPNTFCPACGLSTCKEMGVTAKFLKYNTRSTAQQKAIEVAKERMSDWSLLIHGASITTGNTRYLKDATDRWKKLIEVYGMNVLVVDHVQQYQFGDVESDYEKLVRSVGTISDFITQFGVACIMISQVSLASVRESRSGGILTAAGGRKAAQEANTVVSIKYQSGSGKVMIKVEEARDTGAFSIWQPIDDESGLFYGEPSLDYID